MISDCQRRGTTTTSLTSRRENAILGGVDGDVDTEGGDEPIDKTFATR